MDLHSGQPFWQIKNGLPAVYPALHHEETCDVAIVGGGITGALIAYRLSREGVDVVLLDKREIATGSTAASTGLLQYEIDTELHELAARIGIEPAVRCYRMGLEAVQTIHDLLGVLNDDCGFEFEESLYLATRKVDLGKLRNEYACRKANRFDVDFLESADIRQHFPFDAPGAILSRGNAAIDPHRFTHALFRQAAAQGARIYDRSPVARVVPSDSKIDLQLDSGCSVAAQRVVFAAGYESQEFLKRRIGNLNCTYALASEPIDDFGDWTDRAMIWETARPYFYIRTTPDHRVILGGGDTTFSTDHRRDRLIARKTAALVKRFNQMFPRIRLEIAYAWAGTFAESKDGLPYIGETKEFPRAYFAMCYGGNGITAGVSAAQIICDLFMGRPNADAVLFRFDR